MKTASEQFKFRYLMFLRIPSGTNMVIGYNILEDIFMNKYRDGNLTIDESKIARFDKLKALALGNMNINERKVAFERSIELMEKILGEKLR